MRHLCWISRTLSFVIFLALATNRISAKQVAYARLPVTPIWICHREHALISRTADLINEGKFQQATKLLRSCQTPHIVHVFINWTSVPRTLRHAYGYATLQSFNAWNHALRRTIRFEQCESEDEAQLLITFEVGVVQTGISEQIANASSLRMQSTSKASPTLAPRATTLVCEEFQPYCTPLSNNFNRNYRFGVIRIALCEPYTNTPHKTSSIAHLTGQGLGEYLGLAHTPILSDIMGPDTHAGNVVITPGGVSALAIQRICQIHHALLTSAHNRTRVYLPCPVVSINERMIYAGSVWKGDQAQFIFRVKNTGDAPLEIEEMPACTCTSATFDRIIMPGRGGLITATMNTGKFSGLICKDIEVFSNDPHLPAQTLRLVVNVRPSVEVIASEAGPISLSNLTETVREFFVHIHEREPVQILDTSTNAAFAFASTSPAQSQNGDGTLYRVKLSLNTNAPCGRSLVCVMLHTTSPREPITSFYAVCEKGICTMPTSVYLGSANLEQGQPSECVIIVRKTEGKFKVQRLECEDPNVMGSVESVCDGEEYLITLTRTNQSSFDSKVTIFTDDAIQPQLVIPVLSRTFTQLHFMEYPAQNYATHGGPLPRLNR